jgi:predicted esterase
MVRLLMLLAFAAPLAGPVGQVDGGGRPVGKVDSCDFPTRSLPPPFRAAKQYDEGHKLFQATGALLPEEITVKSVVLMGNSRIGLTAKEVKGLYAGLDQVYGSISADPLFKNIRSALPYCLADKRPSQGHYFAYYPEKAGDDVPVIVFLHGFGGNFLFYTYLLKEEFPNAVILLPSWGASWHDGTMQYLDDMYADVKRRKSLSIHAPWLMAISAGGPAGFRLYNESPDRFSCYVSLASAPSSKIVPALRNDLKILMVNGKNDSGLPMALIRPVAAQLAERLPHFQFHVLDGDHFFLLARREETFRVIKAFLSKETGRQAESHGKQ